MSERTHVSPTDSRPEISIVIPVYRSARILPKTLKRLDQFFVDHPRTHEFIFVNDGSPDDSWHVLETLKGKREDVIIIDLMRNFGQHSAMLCGLEHSRGDFVVTMDDDLQNPPEEIIRLIDKISEGYDVVFGHFHQKMHGPVRRLGSRIVSWLNLKLFEKPPDLVLTTFRIIRREIVEAVCEINTSTLAKTYPQIAATLVEPSATMINAAAIHRDHWART